MIFHQKFQGVNTPFISLHFIFPSVRCLSPISGWHPSAAVRPEQRFRQRRPGAPAAPAAPAVAERAVLLGLSDVGAAMAKETRRGRDGVATPKKHPKTMGMYWNLTFFWGKKHLISWNFLGGFKGFAYFL